MRSSLLLLLLITAGCGSTEGDRVEPLTSKQPEATATAYTTRLPASDPETQAIVISQTVYGATREENAAGAIILSVQDARLAFTAMHRVTHMPVNAPLFYLTRDGQLSEATKQEMKRVRPDGVVQDGKVQVYVIGRVSDQVVWRIEDELKYTVRRFHSHDPVELAHELDLWQAAFKSDHPDEVVVSAVDHSEGMLHGIGAMGWNAHMGKGFAWVNTDSVPEATRKILQRRFGRDGAYIYLTGGPDVISDAVAKELAQYGLVRRIYGTDIYASNAVNAGYKDFGRNYGWWWGWQTRSFGWGLAQAGHNYIINSSENILGAIPSALLGHMGKHGPILLVEPGQVPQSVVNYLEMVKPFASAPDKTIRNHAWIIGSEQELSWDVQKEVHKLLQPGKVAEKQQLGWNDQGLIQSVHRGK